MTNGSSQGLFVIVAVVIFGIFLVISYMLFRDKLQTGLASIFQESTFQSKEIFVPFTSMNNFVLNSVTKGADDNLLISDSYLGSTDKYTIGLRNSDLIEVPWNYRLIIVFEIYYEGDSEIYTSVDFNSFPEGTNNTTAWDASDNYGTTSANSANKHMYEHDLLKPNTWNEIEIWYNNDSIKNTKKESIYDGTTASGGYGTTIGLQRSARNTTTQFKIRNVKYKLVKL